MRHQRFVWTVLASAVCLSPVGAPQAWAQRFYALPSYPTGPFMGAPLTQPYTPYSNYFYGAPDSYYIPYVAPYPAYGILPPPFVTAQAYQTREPGTTGKTAEDYGKRIDSQPRMRGSVYPAVPYEKTPAELLAESRRVRYEIEVPFADAVLYIDGVKTKKTGLKRVFVTPPMDEDRTYTATIKVEWVDQFQKTRQREQTFNFVAGETVRHQFKE